MDLVTALHRFTEVFPQEERFGLTAQMKRSACSIPSNIAEGRLRGSKRDFLKYLRIAYGSGAELETQLELTKRIFPIDVQQFEEVEGLLTEVMKILNVMLRKMNPSKKTKEASEANEASEAR